MPAFNFEIFLKLPHFLRDLLFLNLLTDSYIQGKSAFIAGFYWYSNIFFKTNCIFANIISLFKYLLLYSCQNSFFWFKLCKFYNTPSALLSFMFAFNKIFKTERKGFGTLNHKKCSGQARLGAKETNIVLAK